MDDQWETAFGLDAETADGGLDPDGDGLTNLQEHDSGTHPRGFFKRYLAEGADSRPSPRGPAARA